MTYLQNLSQHLQLFSSLDILDDDITQAISIISLSLSQGGKLLLCGNGGSAADCQHIAAEFTGRFSKDRLPIGAISLTTDSSALTCISNDYSYEDVFKRQVQALGRKGDCLIGISTSGNSRNIFEAIRFANSIDINTIGLLGNNGGIIGPICDTKIVVPSQNTARIQEAHILIGHTICGEVEIKMGLV